jgi:hypothetical protein
LPFFVPLLAPVFLVPDVLFGFAREGF